MNQLSVVRVQNKWRPEVFYSVFAIDGMVINEWIAQFTDSSPNILSDLSARDLTVSLELYDCSDTELVWQYLGLPSNAPTTYVPILACPDDLDLDCSVVVTEQSSDENYVYWERFGALLDDLEKQDPEIVEWFADVPKVTFEKTNFMQVFGQLNAEVVKEFQDRGKIIKIPFPAKPLKEDWEKIVDSWF